MSAKADGWLARELAAAEIERQELEAARRRITRRTRKIIGEEKKG